jgi:hypothetical protein
MTQKGFVATLARRQRKAFPSQTLSPGLNFTISYGSESETSCLASELRIQAAALGGEDYSQFVRVRMVLPVRIELTTLALPRTWFAP